MRLRQNPVFLTQMCGRGVQTGRGGKKSVFSLPDKDVGRSAQNGVSMKKEDKRYQAYLRILKEELVPAMGCTEPIALAYCAAKAREILGGLPESVLVEASGNIIKNVKSVVVPNTNGLKGMEAAAAAGIVAGEADRALEVIADVTEEQKEEISRFLRAGRIQVRGMDTEEVLDMAVTLRKGGEEARVQIAGSHTNIVLMEKNGETLYRGKSGNKKLHAAKEPAYDDRLSGEGYETEEETEGGNTEDADRALLNMEAIYEFADTVEPEDVREVIGRQIALNTAISEEGLNGNYGANIGRVLLHTYGNDIKNRAKAAAAAGSDARMSGCEMPVVINSGSGNQGMTVSLPVIEYAKELGCSQEKLYRALVLSNLTAIHQKSGIGRLSAYCGAVSAGCAAGCGIAYLQGGDLEAVNHTLVNALAIVSGIICDGAKPSCAAKIASSVDAGILGYAMYTKGQQFYGGDGIISKGVEKTIGNVGRLGKDGMKETDKEIIRIMTGC